MAKIFPSKIAIAADTAANWAISTRILEASEMAYETDTGKMYIGDSVNFISSGLLRFVTFGL